MKFRKFISFIFIAIFAVFASVTAASASETPSKVVKFKVKAEKVAPQPVANVGSPNFVRTDALVFYENDFSFLKNEICIAEFNNFQYEKLNKWSFGLKQPTIYRISRSATLIVREKTAPTATANSKHFRNQFPYERELEFIYV